MISSWISTALICAALIASPKFENVTEEWGLEPFHLLGPNTIAIGAAFFDWDKDGYLDVYLAGGTSPNLLMRNQGPPHFGFKDVSVESGIDDLMIQNTGVIAADFTGDGLTDLFLISGADIGTWTDGSTGGPALLVAQPDGTFVNESQFRVIAPKSGYETGAHGDPDGDGDIDVILVRWSYLVEPARASDCRESHFFENKNGVLTWVPEYSKYMPGCGFAAAFSDFDHDGDADYIQINDYGMWFVPNKVLRNDGLDANGQLILKEDIAPQLGLDHEVYGMGIGVGDINADLKPDYIITSMAEDVLAAGTENGTYKDVTHEWQAGSPLGRGGRRWKWGAVFFDVENDGDDDLAVAASMLDPALDTSPDNEASILYINNGKPPLEDMALPAGTSTTTRDRVILPADINRDGLLDMLTIALDSTHLLLNQTNSKENYISIKLQGTVSNRDGIGARIYVTACDQTRFSELLGGGVPGGTLTPEIHTGLGNCDTPADVKVQWPSGYEQTVTSLAVNTQHTIIEDEWFRVSKTRVVANGKDSLTITYTPHQNQAKNIKFKSSIGQLSSPVESSNGSYEATLTAPGEPGEAVVSVVLDGESPPACRRVVFAGPEEVRWSPKPYLPHKDRPFHVGLQLMTADGAAPKGTISVITEHGNIDNVKVITDGKVLIAISPAENVDSVTLQATLDGKAFGGEYAVKLQPAVDPIKSRLSLQKLPPGKKPTSNGHRIILSPIDSIGWTSPLPEWKIPVKLFKDGKPLDPQPKFLSNNNLTSYATFWTKGQLEAGTYSAEVLGIPIAQTATHTGEPFKASDVSVEQSIFIFIDGHVHADGEDVVPLFIIIRDKEGQSVQQPDQLNLSFECDGCTVIADSLHEYLFDESYGALIHVRIGDKEGPVKVSMFLNGEATGLVAETKATEPAPYTAQKARTTIEFMAPKDDKKTLESLPADGQSEARVRVILRDSSDNRIGSGIGMQIKSAGDNITSFEYVGFGVYEAVLKTPQDACTDTISVHVDGWDTPRTTTFDFTSESNTSLESCKPVEPTPIEPAPDADAGAPSEQTDTVPPATSSNAGSDGGCSHHPNGSPTNHFGIVVVCLLVALRFRQQYIR